MNFVDCKAIAEDIKREVACDIEDYVSLPFNEQVELNIITAGNDPASEVYVRGKLKDCKEVGIATRVFNIVPRYKEQVLGELQQYLGAISWERGTYGSVIGVIVQLPLPFGLGIDDIKKWMNPMRDVDGFCEHSPFKPCTPLGVMEVIHKVASKQAKHVVVAGRSQLVGKPLADMLLAENYTVTTCHSHTPEPLLKQLAAQADIFVSAVGQPSLLTTDDFKDGSLVIDVGINRIDGKLCGDIEVTDTSKDLTITPVPGGIGLLTRAMLLRNTADIINHKIGE